MRFLVVIIFFNIGLCINAQNHPEFIFVKGGSFIMGDEKGQGDANERPSHKVTVDNFSISKTEITIGQYREFCKATGTSMPEGIYWEVNDNHPIVNVTWDDAIAYTKWLSKELNKTIRLPYEAEWEYAAKGGQKSKGFIYSGTNNILDVWFEDNSNEQTQPVGLKPANELGLYDMSGNAMEWCMDVYDKDYYTKNAGVNPKGPGDGKRRVLRGGAWWYKKFYCRVTQRSHATPDYISYVFGFRVLLEE